MTIIKLKKKLSPPEQLKEFIEESLSEIHDLNIKENLDSSNIPNIKEIVKEFLDLLYEVNISVNITYIENNGYSLLIQDKNKHKKILNQTCENLQETFYDTKNNYNDLNYLNENLLGLNSKKYTPLIIMGIIYVLNTNKATEEIIIRNVPGNKKSQIISYFRRQKNRIETIINKTLYSLYKHNSPYPDKKFNIELQISSKKQDNEESGVIKNYYTITLNLKNKNTGETTY